MMAKENYFGAFVITDSAKKIEETDGTLQIVKYSAFPDNRIPDGFTAFCWAAVVGHKDHEGRVFESIMGDENEVTITANQMLGMIPLPWEKTIAIGEDFTAPNVVEYEAAQKGQTKEGFAKVTQIIYAKTIEDVNAILNWGKEMETKTGIPTKMADEANSVSGYGGYSYPTTSPAASQAADNLMKAESYEDFFGEEYENFMAEYAMSLMPPHYHYEANV